MIDFITNHPVVAIIVLFLLLIGFWIASRSTEILLSGIKGVLEILILELRGAAPAARAGIYNFFMGCIAGVIALT